MQKEPLISVLIPYYNDKNFLSLSIESVLNSSYNNIELFLLNHASTDGSRDIARSYLDPRIHHIDISINYGAGGGLLVEEFLKKANGKYIKFFCADDQLKKTGLYELVSYMENHPDIDFAFGNLTYIDELSNPIGDNWFNNRKNFSIKFNEIDYIHQYSNGISSLPWVGSIVKRECILKLELNKVFVMLFDMTIWLSLLCKGYKLGFINKEIALYRIHNAQVSSPTVNDTINIYSFFEHKLFWKYFLSISDISLVKQIWPESRLNPFLKEKKDIKFVVAYNLFINRKFSEQSSQFLMEALNSNNSYYESQFRYGVKELREDFLSFKTKNESINKEQKIWEKQKIYKKNPKDLSIFDLFFLILRKIFYFVKKFFHTRSIKDKKEKAQATM